MRIGQLFGGHYRKKTATPSASGDVPTTPVADGLTQMPAFAAGDLGSRGSQASEAHPVAEDVAGAL
jgi:hypothetical protein